jgi:N-acetylglucosamine transport system substrate-binding protein
MNKLSIPSALALLTLFGCSSSGGGGKSATTAADTTSDSTVAEAPTGEGAVSGSLDVAAFQGGYGIDFYQQAAKEFDAKHGTTTNVWGSPNVWKQLQPKMLADTPPDLMFPGWGMDHWALIEENQVDALDKALDSPAAEGGGKWGDTFEPALLELGKDNGKQYMLPYYFNVMGWWYDPGVFAKNGWTPPKTYDELLTLCEKIKAKGIAPLTFQGQYPYYMIYGMLLPWAQSVGGVQAIKDIQNLVPGAWKSPAILQAATMIKDLNDKGDLEKGAVGMTHTASQMEFLLGHAAMIPCGTWLSSEEKKTMPPGTKMQFFIPPVVAGGKGDPSAVAISIEPWLFPSAAKNANGAVALFKYMTSLSKAKQFVQEKGTLMAIKGSGTGKLPDVLVNAAKAFNESKTVYAWELQYWYPAMEKDLEGALTSLLNNALTPQQFCDRAEADAEVVRKDSTLAKHKL